MSFTDLTLCHRFVRFAVAERNQEKIAAKVPEFVEELRKMESGVLYHRLQEDEDAPSAGEAKTGLQFYTLCIVVDPTKNSPPAVPKSVAPEEGLLGIMTNVREEVIKEEKGLDGKLSAWVKHFHKLVVPFCADQPVNYFELRPLIYRE